MVDKREAVMIDQSKNASKDCESIGKQLMERNLIQGTSSRPHFCYPGLNLRK